MLPDSSAAAHQVPILNSSLAVLITVDSEAEFTLQLRFMTLTLDTVTDHTMVEVMAMLATDDQLVSEADLDSTVKNLSPTEPNVINTNYLH